MLGWGEAPTEILEIIFFYLKNEYHSLDLNQCSLTCVRWRGVAQPIIFSKVVLYSDAEVSKISSIIAKNSEISRYVKTVLYRRNLLLRQNEDTNLLPSTIISQLFPVVENLSIPGDRRDQFYSSIYKILTVDNRYTHLKTLPLPRKAEHEIIYYKCVWYLRHRITDIYISKTDRNLEDSLYELFRDKLDQFPNLRNVKINIADQTNTHSMTELIEYPSKKNLHSLLGLSIEVTDSPDFILINPHTTEELNNIKPIVNLKKFSAKIFVGGHRLLALNDEFMVYLMKKAPNLTFLYLSIPWDYPDEDGSGSFPRVTNNNASSNDVSIQFFKYITKIPDCRINNFMAITPQSMEKMIQDLFKSIPATNSTQKASRNSIEVEHHFVEGVLQDPDHEFAIIDYNSSANSRIREIKVIFNKSDALFNAQLLRIIEFSGPLVNVLSLFIGRVDNFLSSIGHVAKYGTKLDSLKITCQSPLHQSSFDEVSYIPDVDPNYGIKALTLSRYMPFEGHFIYISNLYPSLESLVIEHFFEQDIINIPGGSFSIHMPNSALKYLEINLKAWDLDYYETGTIYMRLRTADGSNTRYCLLYDNTLGIYDYYLTENPVDVDTVYDNSFNNDRCLHCEIYCKSVQVFVVKYREYKGDIKTVELPATFSKQQSEEGSNT